MDDESFKARVHKVFGSLSSSSSPAWSLTDDEVEKKEWNRSALKQGKDDDDQTLCSSSYDGLFNQKRRSTGNDDDNDVWEIRSSIGLDSTLDNEEEEDEYDRVAEGISVDNDIRVPEREPEPGPAVKPILKRNKDGQLKSTRQVKRVRFDPSCKDDCEVEQLASVKNASNFESSKPKVPDYLVNPSKYTCYSLDESSSRYELKGDDQSVLDVSGTSNYESVSFIPRQKKKNTITEEDETMLKGMIEDESKGFPVGIAAGEAQQSEEDPMEEDTQQPHIAHNNPASQKPQRHYRVKAGTEDTVT